MRFLIREQEYETLVAAGRFQYSQNGQPTGAYESWRLTEISHGYRFLRVDMDTRETKCDDSTLYHLLLDPNGKAERLKLQVLAIGKQLQGDILFEKNSIIVSGETGKGRFENDLSLENEYAFYFSTAVGFALLLRQALDHKEISAVTFNKAQTALLYHQSIQITSAKAEVIEVVRQDIVAHPYLIHWSGHEIHLWLDNHRWPLKIDFGNGQVAKETQYIRYS